MGDRKRCSRGALSRAWGVAAALAFTAGCVAFSPLVDQPRSRVVGIHDGAVPGAGLPAYAGPHPSAFGQDMARRFRFPVRLGEVGPIDHSLGPLQYPFACQTEDSRLGPPLIDNHRGHGTPVLVERRGKSEIAGYSKDCLVPTRAEYYYRPTGSASLRRLPVGPELPQDVEYVGIGGEAVPFIVRVERGTLNRFIYMIAVLAAPAEALDRPSARYWNGKLIYYFRGGVGVGRRQGKASVGATLSRRLNELARGYAVIYSTGTHTKTHYNLRLAGTTAAMVKAQFVALYGEPRYTLGIGESGGAVQQFLIAQNQPGLLDGLIPLYSFPDMITQTIWALDCELLEYYFDITAAESRRWRRQEERTWIEGVAADSGAANVFSRLDYWARLLSLRLPRLPPGATECSKAWRGLTALVNNPTYTDQWQRYAPEVRARTRFSHWDDLVNVYGTDEHGHARRTWDNVGVQYGLEALRSGALAVEEFLHLNANVGGWKPAVEMRGERYWKLSEDRSLRRLSLWSDHNMQKTPGGPTSLEAIAARDPAAIRVAPRTRGDPSAVRAAFASGHVFLGNLAVPVIDARHYVDHELDLHHSFASFSTRLRMERAGAADHHVIWMAVRPLDLTPLALDALDRWLLDGERPDAAEDACWERDGRLIARGREVWHGAWRGADETGACLARFPAYRSPRDAAGAPRTGDVFQCALIPVDAAIDRGIYAPVDPRPWAAVLRKIFPDGVCDYSRSPPA